MSKLLDRVVRGMFILGVVGAIGLGAQAAFAADRVSSCLCDPEDPDANEFCESVPCCNAAGSICPAGGSGLRECLCA
jgi:hypothetical protein